MINGTKNIYAVLAHHDASSTLGKLFTEVTAHLEASGYSVDRLNLYDRSAEIPFYVPEYSSKTLEHLTVPGGNFFLENKSRFMNADYLIIMYPIYWYSVPGILKCWIDLITNFAWKYEGGHKARPLHHIQRAFVVQSGFQSSWRRWLHGNLEKKQLERTFDFIGIPKYSFYHIDNAGLLNSETINKHAVQLCSRVVDVVR